jgi:hypothetical protein
LNSLFLTFSIVESKSESFSLFIKNLLFFHQEYIL